jgi:hypothetical protein
MPSLRDATRSLLPEGYGGQLLETLRERQRFFNEPQRRREHRGRKERSHGRDFAGDRSF